MTTRRLRFVYANLAWQLAVVVLLAAVGEVALDLFLSLSFLGFLVVTELTAPVNVRPGWRRRLRWLLLAGVVGFGYLIVRRILNVLPPGVI